MRSSLRALMPLKALTRRFNGPLNLRRNQFPLDSASAPSKLLLLRSPFSARFLCTSSSGSSGVSGLEEAIADLKRQVEETGLTPSPEAVREIEEKFGVSLKITGGGASGGGTTEQSSQEGDDLLLEEPKEEGTLLSPLGESSSLGRIAPTMMIAFTCNVCGLRQSKSMSKKSYEEGVVLITCDGCKNRHLIADNLGWFGNPGANVESILQEKGIDVRKFQEEGELQLTEEDLADLELGKAHAEQRQAQRDAKNMEK